MNILNKGLEQYGKFIARLPHILLLIAILLTIFMSVQSQKVETVSSDNSDSLPDDLEVITAFDKIHDKFGSTDTAMIIIQLDEDEYGTINDMYDYKILEYVDLISSLAAEVEDVESISSPTISLRKINGGTLPNTKNEIKSLINENKIIQSFFSDNHDMLKITINLKEDYNQEEMLIDLQSIVNQVNIPSGIKTDVGGASLADAVVKKELGNDMSRTSMFSMVGILIVLLLMFRSFRYGLTPLATIVIGLIWTMGFIGLQGMNLTSATSGVMSMIMGIGIDFGIQIVSRFRQELRISNSEKSMITTLHAVFMPMTTTTLSAVIGFRAMGLGQLTMLADMGTMMAYGVIGCYLAAFIAVPPILIIFEDLFPTKKRN